MARTPKRLGKEPRLGSRFPSQILGQNVKEARALLGLKQTDLLERLRALGHDWKQVTLSELERGVRPTSVDELFALALALETTVVKLMDPRGMAGQRNAGVDLGLDFGTTGTHEARAYLLNASDPFSIQPDVGIAWEGNKPLMFIEYVNAGLGGFEHLLDGPQLQRRRFGCG